MTHNRDLGADRRYAALPVQIIEVPQGAIVRRGTVEMLVSGEGAVEAITRVLTEAGASPAGCREQDLVASIRGVWPDDEAAGLIAELRKRMILVDAEDMPPYPESPDQILAWNLGTMPAAVAAAFDRVSINVLGVNLVSRRLVESLVSVGANVRVVDHPELRNVRLFRSDETLSRDAWGTEQPEEYGEWEKTLPAAGSVCLVACSDFGGLQLLADWNRAAYQRGWSFLPVVLQNLIGLVGPFVFPGETSCFQCLLERENSNTSEWANKRAAEAFAFEGQSVAAYHPSMASALGDLAALELNKYYAYGLGSAAIGSTIEMDLLSAAMRLRPILKAPACPVCSSLDARGGVELLRQAMLKSR